MPPSLNRKLLLARECGNARAARPPPLPPPLPRHSRVLECRARHPCVCALFTAADLIQIRGSAGRGRDEAKRNETTGEGESKLGCAPLMTRQNHRPLNGIPFLSLNECRDFRNPSLFKLMISFFLDKTRSFFFLFQGVCEYSGSFSFFFFEITRVISLGEDARVDRVILDFVF